MPRGNLRDAQREATRGLLVEAATRVFGAVGYVKATVDQIAAQAGASRATFYLHFPNKSALLKPIMERASGNFTDLYAGLPDAIRSRQRGPIHEWIVEAMNQWREIEDVMRPIYEAADADPALFHDIFPSELPGIEDMTNAIVRAELGLSEAEAGVYSEVLFAPLMFYFRRHLRGEPFDHALAASVIADTWSRMLTRP